MKEYKSNLPQVYKNAIDNRTKDIPTTCLFSPISESTNGNSFITEFLIESELFRDELLWTDYFKVLDTFSLPGPYKYTHSSEANKVH